MVIFVTAFGVARLTKIVFLFTVKICAFLALSKFILSLPSHSYGNDGYKRPRGPGSPQPELFRASTSVVAIIKTILI